MVLTHIRVGSNEPAFFTDLRRPWPWVVVYLICVESVLRPAEVVAAFPFTSNMTLQCIRGKVGSKSKARRTLVSIVGTMHVFTARTKSWYYEVIERIMNIGCCRVAFGCQ